MKKMLVCELQFLLNLLTYFI